MANIRRTTSTVSTAAAGATLARLMTSLQVLGGTSTTRLTVRLILALTLDELGIVPCEWEARKKATDRTTRCITRAGQLAAWLAHRHTAVSIAGIGRQLYRNHATVLHALKRMPEILATEPEIARAAERLEERIAKLAAVPADSAEARTLLPPGKWTHLAEARP
jgi:chromosomal replication initiator protein